jgi:hypothetical protein
VPMWAPRTPLRSHPETDKAESAQIPTRLAPRATECPKSWSFRTVCKTFAYHPVTMDRDGVRRS